MTVIDESGRYERKFLIPHSEYHHLERWLQNREEGFYRPYPSRLINNVYFDRPTFEAYSDSLSGVSDRAKVRYRWYGTSPFPIAGQLEVKRRRNRVGWKLTFRVDADFDTCSDWTSLTRVIYRELPPEGRFWLSEHPLPVLLNRYSRAYWASRCGAIRVTLDTGHRVFDQRYGRIPDTWKHATLDRVVMEIKCPPSEVESACRLLARLPVPVSRHSKYCSGLEALAT